MPLNCPLCKLRISTDNPTCTPGYAADHVGRKWLESHLRVSHGFYRTEASRVTQDVLSRTYADQQATINRRTTR
jgi:hypothetical protein